MSDIRVLPQPNLPPDSVQWARETNKGVRDSSREIARLTLNQEMNNRATAGQMGVIGRQLEELTLVVQDLRGRSSHQEAPGDLQLVYGTGSGQKGPVTATFSFPEPTGVGRTATLIGSGVFEWTGGTSASAQPINMRLEVRHAGSLISTNVATVSPRPFLPADFEGNSFTVAASVPVPQGSDPVFQLRLFGYRSASGGVSNDAGSVRGMSFTLTYGDRT